MMDTLFIVLWSCAAVLFCVSVGEDVGKLAFSSLQIGATSVEIHLQPGLNSTTLHGCDISYAIEGNATFVDVLTEQLPKNGTFYLTSLHPSTMYEVNIVCHGTQNSKMKVNFTTESEPSNKTSELPSSPGLPIVIRPVLSTHAPSRPSSHNLTPLTLTPVPPTQFATDIAHTSMPPRDVWLGVALGLLGVGGFICGGYYVLKEYRRRMRIRRFLQYRQQENETFPDIDQDEDEGIVL